MRRIDEPLSHSLSSFLFSFSLASFLLSLLSSFTSSHSFLSLSLSAIFPLYLFFHSPSLSFSSISSFTRPFSLLFRSSSFFHHKPFFSFYLSLFLIFTFSIHSLFPLYLKHLHTLSAPPLSLSSFVLSPTRSHARKWILCKERWKKCLLNSRYQIRVVWTAISVGNRLGNRVSNPCGVCWFSLSLIPMAKNRGGQTVCLIFDQVGKGGMIYLVLFVFLLLTNIKY